MRIHHLFVAAAILATTAIADAKPCRITILDFEGPVTLANAGRAAVARALGDYNLLPSKRWDAVKAQTTTHGASKWFETSIITGVDAVAEGWIDPEDTGTLLVIEVRDAATGRQVDFVRLPIGNDGTVDTHKLKAELDDTLAWLHPGLYWSRPPADESFRCPAESP